MKILNSTKGNHMEPQNYLRIILLKSTENLIKFLLAMEFYLIMKAQEEEKRLLLEKLQGF